MPPPPLYLDTGTDEVGQSKVTATSELERVRERNLVNAVRWSIHDIEYSATT